MTKLRGTIVGALNNYFETTNLWSNLETQATKCEQVLAKLIRKKQIPPELAIIDYCLAGDLNGLWLCKLIESRFPKTQIILISSTPAERLKIKMALFNIHPEFMPKPFNIDCFVNILNRTQN